MDNNRDTFDEAIGSLLQIEPVQTTFPPSIKKSLKTLNRLMMLNESYQEYLAAEETFSAWFKKFLFKNNWVDCDDDRRATWRIALALLVNSIVKNEGAQKLALPNYGNCILEHCESTPLDFHTGMYLMFLYNVRVTQKDRQHEIGRLMTLCAVRVWQTIIEKQYMKSFQYLDFVFEYIIVTDPYNSKRILHEEFAEREAAGLLDYIAHYLYNECPNGAVNKELLLSVAELYKKITDRYISNSKVLLDISDYDAAIFYHMMRIIAIVACKSTLFREDHVLFINTAAMLCLQAQLGKQKTTNIFTPLTKLDEVAPNSSHTKSFEREVSYELKTQLMRIISNLVHRNPKNKQYAQDMNLVPIIMECTNIDARNPMLREYSILALHGLCEDCPEIQEFIAKTRYVGPAKNDIVTELNMSLGSMRINPEMTARMRTEADDKS